MTRRMPAIACLLAIALSLFGCGSVEEKKQAIVLENTLAAYENTVRWGNLSNAYQFLSPDDDRDRQAPPDLNDIRVVSYEVVSSPVRMDEDTALQTVRIDYLRVDEQKVRNLIDRQVWKYEADSKLWYLDSEFPEFH